MTVRRRALLFGTTGQVAQALLYGASAQWRIHALGRREADLSFPERCAQAIADADVDVVINAAAYTAVDRAESEPELAHRVNAEAPAEMARAAARKGCPLVHISTDYVFDGSGNTPWQVDAPTRPLSVYGRTKADGEAAVREMASARHGIVRTSWVFSATGHNFVKTMLRLGRSREKLSVVGDQIGGPTAAPQIAKAVLACAERLIQGGDAGTFHFSGTPDVSWADFARTIFEVAGLSARVETIATEAYPTPAPRPRNSRLDCRTTQSCLGLNQPDWRSDLTRLLSAFR